MVVIALAIGCAALIVALGLRSRGDQPALREAVAETLPRDDDLDVQLDGFGDFDAFPRVQVSGRGLPDFARFGPRDHASFEGGSFRTGDAGFDGVVAVATQDRLLTLAALDAPTRSAIAAAVRLGAVYDDRRWIHAHRASYSGPGSRERELHAARISAQVLTRAATALRDAATRVGSATRDRCLIDNIGRDHDRGYSLACLDALERLGSPLLGEARAALRHARDPATRLAGLERAPDPTPADFEALVLGPAPAPTRLEALARLDALDPAAGKRVIRRLLDADPRSLPLPLARTVVSRAPNDTPIDAARRWAAHPDHTIRRDLVALLTRLDDGAIAVLLMMLAEADPDADADVMIAVARALKWRADASAVGPLRRARPTERRHRAIQQAIDEALATLAGKAPRGALSEATTGGGELSPARDPDDDRA